MPRKFKGLTPREKQVAEALLDGYQNPQIGLKLKIAERSVKAHMRKMFRFFLHGDQGIKRIRLAVHLHDNRAELGIRCRACGD